MKRPIECSEFDCTESVFKGFTPFIDNGNFDNPVQVDLGPSVYWCKNHESGGRVRFSDQPGIWLTELHIKLVNM